VAEECLLGQPHHDVRVLAQGPQHGQLVDAVEGLAQDVDALRFQPVEMIHRENVVVGSRNDKNRD
jgi:hypothetical protein